MIPHTPAQTIWSLALALTCLYALWKGQEPERLAAVGFLVAHLATAAVHYSHYWDGLQWPSIGIDAALLALMLTILLRSRRWWPQAAVALALLTLGMDLIPLVSPDLRPRAYYVATVIWSYLQLLILALGVRMEAHPRLARRRLERHAIG